MSTQVPRQTNDYDCGLFVLYYMERFIQEAPRRLMKQDLSMIRRTCNGSLVSYQAHNNLFVNFVLFCSHAFIILFQFGKNWFKPQEASKLRGKIKRILQDEFHKALKQDDWTWEPVCLSANAATEKSIDGSES